MRMEEKKTRIIIIRRLLVGFGFALAFWGVAPNGVFGQANPELHETKERADCLNYLGKPAPRFHTARKIWGDSKQTLIIQGSLSPTDFDKWKLVALVCKLGNENADTDLLIIWIFDCYECAKNYAPLGDVGISRKKYGPVRASFGFTRERQPSQQSLWWWPDPKDRNTWVSIDLGPPPPRPERKKGN